MPHAATTSAARAAIAGRGGESILRLGWHECPGRAIPTEEAFLDNAYRAAFLTPIFSAVALVLFLRSPRRLPRRPLLPRGDGVITILGALRLFRSPARPKR